MAVSDDRIVCNLYCVSYYLNRNSKELEGIISEYFNNNLLLNVVLESAIFFYTLNAKHSKFYLCQAEQIILSLSKEEEIRGEHYKVVEIISVFGEGISDRGIFRAHCTCSLR